MIVKAFENSGIADFCIEQNNFLIGGPCNAIQSIKYDADEYNDGLYLDASISQPKAFDSFVKKRKAQFLAGRLAAKNALYCLDNSTLESNQNVSIGLSREPIWPSGIVGSISHDDDVSIAIAYKKNVSISGVGVDIQTVLTNKEVELSKPVVLTNKDSHHFELNDKRISPLQLTTLIFSAKESFFKAAFNQVGVYFDFDAVYVSSINIETNHLILKCNYSLANDIQRDDCFRVDFRTIENKTSQIYTHCLIRNN